MGQEIPSDGAYKPRSALGDVTNQVGKREFSFISKSGVNYGDGCKKDEGFQFAKKGCAGVDKSKKENIHKETVESVLRPNSCSEINSSKGNIIDSVSKFACEIKQPCTRDVRQNAISSTDVKTNDAVKDSYVPTNPSDGNGPQTERTDSAPENTSKDKMENSLGLGDGDYACFDNLDLSKVEYIDCSRLLESQESRCGLERCIGQKGDGFSRMCADLIKACACSFCREAAYIWSDLHYQDIKGRIAVIKKSQNEASTLVQQNSRDGASGRYGHGNLEKLSNLNSDLTGRWRSLFVHMEDIFVREGSQLETSLSALKELRENCKIDLEKQ